MTLTTQEPKLNLRPGPNWSSFEKFRTEGAKALEPLKEGKVATLQTKTGQYRILEEHDFQQLLGLASEVDRLRQGLRLVMCAAHVVQKHPDDDTINLLVAAAMTIDSVPVLPTRNGFNSLRLEDLDIDPDDNDDDEDIDLDQIERPLDSSNVVLR